jgi:hypothetical protein
MKKEKAIVNSSLTCLSAKKSSENSWSFLLLLILSLQQN